MSEIFPAHILPAEKNGKREDIIQTVEAHCRGTAKYAAQALEGVGLSDSGYLLGLIHDCGKYTEGFKEYITKAVHGEPVQKGSVNHTFAGVRLLMERYYGDGSKFSDVACEAFALAVGGHHGLIDCFDEKQKNGIKHRMTTPNIGYDEVLEHYFKLCESEEKLDTVFQSAATEMEVVLNCILDMTSEERECYDEETAFYAGLLVRLLCSGVVEGDRRDTAEFANVECHEDVLTAEKMKPIWISCLKRMEEKLDAFPCSTEIAWGRKEISNRCKAAAADEGGIWRLNAPTGGGKTLSSLRYALTHAIKNRKRRIFYIAPLLTILDQNAEVIRSFIQDDSLILEHHSNLVRETFSSEELKTHELLTENWNAPLIITTMVQLLDTLFSGKMSAVRRFQSLMDSVIIIDEVQTVPLHMLSMFSLAMNFLAEVCNTTVVLCSATQPCLEEISHPLHFPIRDILPYDEKLWKLFRRTQIYDGGSGTQEEIADKAEEILEWANSLLIVCNRKDQARELFLRLQSEQYQCFHLSADMCQKHRKKVLKELRESLAEENKKVVCVSTNVIEAGVDISFECVIRFAAGMDSTVQAAGRCNRNGESKEIASVFVMQCLGEKLGRLQSIQKGKDATLDLLSAYRQNADDFINDLASDEAIRYYYKSLYKHMAIGETDYSIEGRAYTLFSLLSLNETLATEENMGDTTQYFRQAFRLAGKLFQVFDDESVDVIVAYEEGEEIIAELSSAKAAFDTAYKKKLLNKAKPYMISLYGYQLEKLEKEGDVIDLNDGVLALRGHYNSKTGFLFNEQGELEFLEV